MLILWLVSVGVVALTLGLGLGLGLSRRTGAGNETFEPPASLLSHLDWVDLTYSYNDSTIYWPTSPSTFELDVLAFGNTENGYFYSSNRICTPEHGGTHMDAPIHFAEQGWTVDEIPLDKLHGPGIVIDITAQAALDPDYRLTLDDVLAFEATHGEIPPGTMLFLRTGWGSKYNNVKEYLGDTTPGEASNLHFPSYGEEAARYLVDTRQVQVLGIDTASIDYGPSTDFIVHQIANGANVPGLENVANLDRLPSDGFYVIGLPMKIGGGSGGPIRLVALRSLAPSLR